jgi:hypothetical protein
MGCAAPVPLPEVNVNPLFSEGFGGQNYRWLTMDRCGHCRRSWSESGSPSVRSRDVPDVGGVHLHIEEKLRFDVSLSLRIESEKLLSWQVDEVELSKSSE